MLLPREYYPTVTTPLIRVGSPNDGGYIIPKKSIDATKIIFGFGIETNWDFEEELQKLSSALVKCFDHTVRINFGIGAFVLNGLRFLLNKKQRTLSNLYSLLIYPSFRMKYKKFFDGKKAFHFQQRIAPKEFGGVDLNELVEEHGKRECFFKIDIEGGEYRILDQLIKYDKQITGLVIEFHDCDLHEERIISFIKRFGLELVHIHANNAGGNDTNGNPLVIELTFSPSEYNTSLKEQLDKMIEYPIDGLDRSNIPLLKDYSILKFRDK